MTYREVIAQNKNANAAKKQNAAAAAGPARVYAAEELANDDDIRRVFNSYAKSLSDAEGAQLGIPFLNPMQFVAILRLVTGQKSNLYKEMQMFKK